MVTSLLTDLDARGSIPCSAVGYFSNREIRTVFVFQGLQILDHRKEFQFCPSSYVFSVETSFTAEN